MFMGEQSSTWIGDLRAFERFSCRTTLLDQRALSIGLNGGKFIICLMGYDWNYQCDDCDCCNGACYVCHNTCERATPEDGSAKKRSKIASIALVIGSTMD